MANLNLKFFNKRGNPLNFNYIGPTGPTPLDSKFVYLLTTGTSSAGDLDITDSGLNYNFNFFFEDLNNFDLLEWYNEVDYFLVQGASVFLNGSVVGSQNFRGKISSISLVGNVITAVIPKENYEGQSIISNGNQIYFNTTYEDRPGGYFKGNIYFDPVSTGLYENEQIFIVQEVDSVSGRQYVLPHTGATGATAGKWRSRWYNDNYGETDITEILFTYSIQDELAGGDGQPLIVSYPNLVFGVDVDPNDYLVDGFVYTTTLNSEALSVNVALNASEEAESVYERKLIIEDISSGTPERILEVDFYGQVIGEDERFKVLLENLGRAFYKSDSVILRDHDPNEPFPNYLEINEKRKELLVAGEDLFPYIGSYRGLISAIKFFGYQDLRIKEYWLNLEYRSLRLESPLQQNQSFLNAIKAQQLQNGYTLGYSVADVLDNPNSGKYRLTQTYGPDKDGNYVLDVSSENTLVPSRTYKKTSLFGLYYDLNKITTEFDEYGYPIVVDAFNFTQEEVLLKLFALKNRLKESYLPLNARIIDITGEGVYFAVYNTRSWTDFMERSEFNSGFYFDFLPNPDLGFVEDLRNFSVRPLQTAIQTPSSYDNYFTSDVDFQGGLTGSAIYFGAGLPGGSTGPNPTISVTCGNTYVFNVKDTLLQGYSFVITTDPLLSQSDPLGIVGNGATAGGSVTWYVEPTQGSPVYYYSPQNPSLMSGVINVLPATISDLGNIVNPLDSQQIHSVAANNSLVSAIDQFYYLKQNNLLVELGDDIFDPNAYIDPLTGQPYVNPVGMPVILQIDVDPWTWDELNINWSAISIPNFHVGDRVQMRAGITGGFGTVTAVSYSTGVYTVLMDATLTTQNFDVAELFSTIQDYQILNWQNIDFSNSLEIEWIVDKSPGQPGSPYHFEFRGLIYDYYRLAHFLPYTGRYDVTCNVYDSFNFRNSLYKRNAIVVQPKVVDIDSWTRYREVEYYDWDNVDRSWNQYNSIWEYPAEGETIDQVAKKIPREILDFATYGNKSEEGQSVFVRTDTAPTGATGAITFTQSTISISEIYSLQIFSGQYGFVTISTASPHGLANGDEITITGTIPQLRGRWVAIVGSSTTTFQIQTVMDSSWSGVILETTPVNRLVVSNTLYPAQIATGIGTISIRVGGRLIGSAETGDTLENTVAAITSAVNSLKTYPDYLAQCPDPTLNPATVIIYAQNDLGNQENGATLDVIATGSISLVSVDSVLGGGANPAENYVFWSENDPELPNPNLKYWGTKRINWEVFLDNTWDDGYAHSWYDFEYNNDWLGGYELHSILPGDHVEVSTGNETFPFPVGVTLTSSSSTITLQQVADQLNNSLEPHITNFWYRPIPDDLGGLLSTAGPQNVQVSNNGVGYSTYPAPPSLIGGSNVLIASFGYTGGSAITTTTTTSTTTTSTTTTSTSTTTTTTTAAPTTTTTTTTTTAAPTTTTSTTTTTTTSAVTTTTSTSTTTTTTTISQYFLNFYGQMGDPSINVGTLYWSTDNTTWNPIAQPFTNSCGLIDSINVNNGDTVYLSIGDPGAAASVYYNAQTGQICPSNFPIYCGIGNPFIITINANTDVAITQYVVAGDIAPCP